MGVEHGGLQNSFGDQARIRLVAAVADGGFDGGEAHLPGTAQLATDSSGGDLHLVACFGADLISVIDLDIGRCVARTHSRFGDSADSCDGLGLGDTHKAPVYRITEPTL